MHKGTLRFSFIPVGESRLGTLAQALWEFTEIASSLGQRTSLVCFFEHDARINSLEKYREHFWWLLTRLHEGDPSSWPPGISEDPDEPTWEFSYNSMPLFVVSNTPYHLRRRSRYFEYFLVTFQPRFVFDNLKTGTPGGDKARAVIRRRLAEYDLVELTPLLGSFSAVGNKEWQQYFLDDDNEPVDPSDGCPIHNRMASHSSVRFDDVRSTMYSPSFTVEPGATLAGLMAVHLPHQGSFEVQHDQPGKIHNWHKHSLAETLFIVEGEAELFWEQDGAVIRKTCGSDVKIQLPAETMHGSSAGPSGCTYFIVPEGGAIPVTTFLRPEEYPTP